MNCVPLILYCLTLPTGADIFWKLVDEDFNNDDWKVRFAAGKDREPRLPFTWVDLWWCGYFPVEKVTMIARLTTRDMIENNQQIMTSLAHAFCYLIGSLDDINSAVVQRTTLYLDTIKQKSVEVGITITSWPYAWLCIYQSFLFFSACAAAWNSNLIRSSVTAPWFSVNSTSCRSSWRNTTSSPGHSSSIALTPSALKLNWTWRVQLMCHPSKVTWNILPCLCPHFSILCKHSPLLVMRTPL